MVTLLPPGRNPGAHFSRLARLVASARATIPSVPTGLTPVRPRRVGGGGGGPGELALDATHYGDAPADDTAAEKAPSGTTPARRLGVTRRVDRLGRVVIPAELRRRLHISEGDVVDIQVVDDCIVIAKVETGCVFCGAAAIAHLHQGRSICETCVDVLKAL